nr:hypothetical protein [Pandoravirus massiliensis]
MQNKRPKKDNNRRTLHRQPFSFFPFSLYPSGVRILLFFFHFFFQSAVRACARGALKKGSKFLSGTLSTRELGSLWALAICTPFRDLANAQRPLVRLCASLARTFRPLFHPIRSIPFFRSLVLRLSLYFPTPTNSRDCAFKSHHHRRRLDGHSVAKKTTPTAKHAHDRGHLPLIRTKKKFKKKSEGKHTRRHCDDDDRIIDCDKTIDWTLFLLNGPDTNNEIDNDVSPRQ